MDGPFPSKKFNQLPWEKTLPNEYLFLNYAWQQSWRLKKISETPNNAHDGLT